MNNSERAATLKKEKIRNNTENIGFLVQTTKIADVRQTAEKIMKRLNLTNIGKRLERYEKPRIKTDFKIQPIYSLV